MSFVIATVVFLLLIITLGLLWFFFRWWYGPRDYSSREYWVERFRDHHRELIDTADQVQQVLMEHELVYWIHAGTLLGAVRHEGIIPWDDDMDFVVLSDAPGFLHRWEKARSELHKRHLSVQSTPFGYQVWNTDFARHVDIMFYRLSHDCMGEARFVGAPVYQRDWPNEFHLVSAVFPLRLYKFDRLQLYGPQNPWPFLSKCYGPRFCTEGRLARPHCMHFTEYLSHPVPAGHRMLITPEEQQTALQLSPGMALYEDLGRRVEFSRLAVLEQGALQPMVRSNRGQANTQTDAIGEGAPGQSSSYMVDAGQIPTIRGQSRNV